MDDSMIGFNTFEAPNGTVEDSIVSNTTQTPHNTMADDFKCRSNGSCFVFWLLRERPLHVAILFRLLATVLLAFSCITILITRRSARLKERPSATFVTNLAVTGGLIGASLIVLSTVLQVNGDPQVGVAICFLLLPRLLHAVTTLTLTCLTLDRYLALCWPLRYPALLTDARCLQLALGSWLLPIVVLVLTCLIGKPLMPCPDLRPHIVSYLLVFTSAIAAVVVMYFLIAREFRRPLGCAVGGEEMEKARRRTARDLMVVVLVNLLLAAPDVSMKLYLLTCPDSLPDLYHVAPLLLLVHLLCFYPLYAWKNQDFRAATTDACLAFRASCSRLLSRASFRVSYVRDSFARLSLSSLSSSRMSSTATTATSVTNAGVDARRVSVEKEQLFSTSSASSSSSLPCTSPPSSSSLSSSSFTAVSPVGQDNAVFQA